jgi:hypothetical protein
MKALKLLKNIGILLILSGISIPKPAFALTGNEFQRLGDRQIDYVMGAVDQIWLQNNIVGKKRVICFPEDTTYGQMLKVTKKYLSDNPELSHEKTPVLVYNAMVNAFPCK